MHNIRQLPKHSRMAGRFRRHNRDIQHIYIQYRTGNDAWGKVLTLLHSYINYFYKSSNKTTHLKFEDLIFFLT